MVISESEYVAQIVADMTPFRDVFNSLFFVSIGMLLDLDLWMSRPGLVAGLVVLVIVGKALIAALAAITSPITRKDQSTDELRFSMHFGFAFATVKAATV